LISALLVISAVTTATYSVLIAHSTAANSSQIAMSNAHESTGTLIQAAYAEQQRFRESALVARKAQLRDVAGPLTTALDQFRALATNGTISVDQAQTAAKAMLRSVRYGEKNADYFFTYDRTGKAIAHPDKALDGRNLIDLQDVNGKYIIRAFIDVAEQEGTGYVDYFWTRLGEKVASPKISYVFHYAPWDWTIGTGVYVDDINVAAAAQLEKTKAALSESFSHINFSANGLLFALDRDGQVVIAPTNRDLTAITTAAWGRDLATTLIAKTPPQSGALTEFETSASFRGAGEQWNVTESSIGELGWTLVSMVPQAEIAEPGNISAQRQGLLSLCVNLLGLCVGLIVSRRLVRPVASMTAAAVALEGQSFEPEMLDRAASRKDEVGVLARAFQRMGSELLQRERHLVEQVKRLTVIIDHHKAEEDAEAITGTEHFHQLAEQAKAMRARFAADKDS